MFIYIYIDINIHLNPFIFTLIDHQMSNSENKLRINRIRIYRKAHPV